MEDIIDETKELAKKEIQKRVNDGIFFQPFGIAKDGIFKLPDFKGVIKYKNILYPSVTNVGHAPTFLEKSPFSIETHMMDFHHTLYGESLIIHFVDWIRPIKKFDSPKHLVAQIKCDIETAQKHFKKIS